MSGKLPIDGSVSKVAAAALLLLCALPLTAARSEQVQTEGEARESTTDYYDKGGRARISRKARTEDRYDALETDGTRQNPAKAAGSSKPSSQAAAAKGSNDFWIYYADVQLFNDDDDDGHFWGIDLLFDADTYFEVADVYAALYLSYEGGPWNEYAVTEPFSIFGATSDDEYVVVTELETGYPTGSYDLLIELYDALDGTFVAEMGPEHNPDLAFLPLEDFNRDDPDHGHHHHDGGGGALDLVTSLAVLVGALVAYRSRRVARNAADSCSCVICTPAIHGGRAPTAHDPNTQKPADDVLMQAIGQAGSRAAAVGGAVPRAARISLRPQADRVSK